MTQIEMMMTEMRAVLKEFRKFDYNVQNGVEILNAIAQEYGYLDEQEATTAYFKYCDQQRARGIYTTV